MVGRIMSKSEGRKTPGKKFATTTYKKGGKIKKMMSGGPMKQGYSPRVSRGATATASSPAAAGVATRTQPLKKVEKLLVKCTAERYTKRKNSGRYQYCLSNLEKDSWTKRRFEGSYFSWIT